MPKAFCVCSVCKFSPPVPPSLPLYLLLELFCTTSQNGSCQELGTVPHPRPCTSMMSPHAGICWQADGLWHMCSEPVAADGNSLEFCPFQLCTELHEVFVKHGCLSFYHTQHMVLDVCIVAVSRKRENSLQDLVRCFIAGGVVLHELVWQVDPTIYLL